MKVRNVTAAALLSVVLPAFGEGDPLVGGSPLNHIEDLNVNGKTYELYFPSRLPQPVMVKSSEGDKLVKTEYKGETLSGTKECEWIYKDSCTSRKEMLNDIRSQLRNGELF